jgi:hypothetical protein
MLAPAAATPATSDRSLEEDSNATEGTQGRPRTLFVINMCQDANGSFHVQVRGAAQGIVATGHVSGDMYRLAADFWTEANVGADDALPLVVQVVEVHNALSQGSSDNLIVHVLSHLTINPDGTVAVSVDSVRSECRGQI